MKPTRRIGVFGGAFDPPHMAHIALVKSAIEELQLDEVFILPTGHAWHKAHALTSPDHRLAMVRYAFEGLSQAVVDEREIRRQGPTYTVDTLEELVAEHPDAQLFLLIGDDQRRSLSAWRRIGDVVRLAIICAAERNADVAPWNEGQNAMHACVDLQVPIRALHMMPMPVSATDIRQRLASGRSVTGLVPAAVERYIHEHHLYGQRPGKPLDD